jgi:hypothetical protein
MTCRFRLRSAPNRNGGLHLDMQPGSPHRPREMLHPPPGARVEGALTNGAGTVPMSRPLTDWLRPTATPVRLEPKTQTRSPGNASHRQSRTCMCPARTRPRRAGDGTGRGHSRRAGPSSFAPRRRRSRSHPLPARRTRTYRCPGQRRTGPGSFAQPRQRSRSKQWRALPAARRRDPLRTPHATAPPP